MAEDASKKEISAEQMRELRTVEHMSTILEYCEQVPILKFPTATLRDVTNQIITEYNEKWFPEESGTAKK